MIRKLTAYKIGQAVREKAALASDQGGTPTMAAR